jgi:hypothetical protein
MTAALLVGLMIVGGRLAYQGLAWLVLAGFALFFRWRLS